MLKNPWQAVRLIASQTAVREAVVRNSEMKSTVVINDLNILKTTWSLYVTRASSTSVTIRVVSTPSIFESNCLPRPESELI